jgi:hypothetical protein
MSSKKNESKKIFENMHVEPEHAQPQNSETAQPEEHKPETSDQDINVMEEAVVPATGATLGDQPAAEQDDAAGDELLEDVRRSLIEEEQAQEQEEQPKWWRRIGRGSRKKAAEQEPPKGVEEINLPGSDVMEPVETSTAETEPEEDLDSIDDLIDLLEREETAVQKPEFVEVPPEPERPVDVEELKKQAFQPRPPAGQDEDLTEVRSIALEGGEEVFVEVQTTKQDPMEERLSAVENAFRPYRRYIYFGIAFLGLIMAVMAGMVLFNIYRRSVVVTPAPEVVSNLPFPTSVSLPGGWSFELGKGSLVDGQWNPNGAEWLQGTEVCRWVALPWSRQLEAVIRTLNPDDPINLGMSNNDVLTYNVHSIEQMSPLEMQELNSNTPCLLIVLAEPEAEERWVLTAVP